MKQLEALTKDQLIDQIAALAVEYRRRFGKSLGVTAEIGEYKAAKLLKLRRAEGSINKGFDAYDSEGKLVQIKTRISSGTRTGLFNNFDFDYALLAILSNEYEVIEIYRAEQRQIQKAIKAQKSKRPSIPKGTFIKIGKQVYPKT
jgi:hypothetical protein